VKTSDAKRRERGDAPAGELCTVDFAAGLLKVHPRTIHRFIREGRLPARRIGKAYRIRRTDLAMLAGLPSTPSEPAASLTAFLDVAHVGPEAARLWKRTVATALASRGPTAPMAEVIHEADTRRLKVVIVGPPAAAVAFLTQAQAWLDNIRD
jgi:excisionase family DNA binding protein